MYCIVAREKGKRRTLYYVTFEDSEYDYDFCYEKECETYDLEPDTFMSKPDALLVLHGIEDKDTDNFEFTVEGVPTCSG